MAAVQFWDSDIHSYPVDDRRITSKLELLTRGRFLQAKLKW